MFLVCLHGYLCHLLMHLGILLLLAVLLTCFTNGRRLSLQSCDCHLRFSSKLLSAALNWQSAIYTDKLSAFMLTQSIFFFDFKEDMGRLLTICRRFLLHRNKWNQEFCVHLLFSISSHCTYLLKIHEEKYLAFFTLKYLYQTTWNDYLTIKSRCISTDVISSRYFCNYS